MRSAPLSLDDALPFPRPVNDFVGRETELSRVRALLPREPLYLIYGVAGIGKTEFVYKIVEEARGLPALRRAPAIALAARQGMRWEQILSALRARLNATSSEAPDSFANDLAAVTKILSARPALVFLDDAHLLDPETTAEVLGYIARYISRSRLFVASQLELLLPPSMPPPVICHLPPLSREATEILIANLSHVLGLNPQSPAEVTELLARSGGSPFYVRRELSNLRCAPRRDSDTLATTLRELPPALRHALLVGNILRGRLSAAELPGEQTPWELSRRFLITVEHGAVVMDDLIREALRRAAEPAEIEAASRDAALLLLTRVNAALADRPTDAAQEVFEAAELLLDASDPAAAWEALERHRSLLTRAGQEHRTLRLLALLRTALPEQRTAVTLRIASLLVRDARLGEAQALVAELGAEGRRPPYLARYLRLSATIAWRTGALERATELLDEALQGAAEPRELFGITLQRACIKTLRGATEQARSELAQALSSHAALTPEDEARVGWVRALSLAVEGRFEQAAEIAAQAAGDGSPGEVAGLERAHLAMLGLLAFCSCDEVHAAAASLKRLQRYEAAASARPSPGLGLCRGLVHYARGELTEARAALEDSYRRGLSHGDLLPAALAGHTLGLVLLGLGDLEGAQVVASRSAELVADAGLAGLGPHVTLLEARVRLALFHLGEAEALLNGLHAAPAMVEAQAEALRAELHGLRAEAGAALSASTRAASIARQHGEALRREVDLKAAEALLLTGDAAAASARAERAQLYYEARGRSQPEAQAALVRAAALVVLAARSEGAASAPQLAEAEELLGVAQALGERHGYALPWAPLVAAALWRRRGEERRARAELLAAMRRVDAASAGLRRAESQEGRLVSWAAAALALPGVDEDVKPCPPGIAALMQSLGLRLAPEVVAAPQSATTLVSAPLGQVQYDLVVDLRRTVIRAPGREDQVAGRPLLCALLAHLAPNDGVYSAERLFYEVWGGREYHPLRHRNTIYVAITRLRRALQELLPGREVVETTPQGWRLSSGVSLSVLGEDASRARAAILATPKRVGVA